MTDEFIPISAVRLPPSVEQRVLGVLASGQLAQGPVVAELEARFAELCAVGHAVAVSSGTTALIAALQGLGVGPGDEVVTSPFTFVATLNAILEAGARVRFADIDPRTFTVDPHALQHSVTEATTVVMPVHLYGQAADMDAVMSIAAVVGARVVEDAAQAHGARFRGRPVGSFDVGCFSLYATKNVTAGEGGIVTTNDDDVADRLRLLRNQGMRQRYEYEVAGHNYRLTDLQAAVAIPQLDEIEHLTAIRQVNARRLSDLLIGIPGLSVPVVAAEADHVFHQFTVRVSGARLDRDALAQALLEQGIGSGIYYPRAVYDYECYRSHPNVCLEPMPEAERAAREVLSLPVHSTLTPDGVERIGTTVRALLS